MAFGNTCPQTDTLGVFAAKSDSEDCLYLNVYAPNNTEQRALPVMVWIHGGGLFDGESNDYDGSKLAKQGDVVVVTINYRLNVFGFLALPALDHEGHTFANYGFMDQQFALKWVRRNIAAFGGDPNKVTIFGKSAGGESVMANLVSPLSKGLFDRGIVESGALLPTVDVTTAEAQGKAFAKTVGCESQTGSQTAACLRSLSVQEIQAMAPEFMSIPFITVDGTVITQTLEASLKSGDYNQVPVIDGTNKDEYRFFVGLSELTTDKVLTAEQYPERIRKGDGLLPGYGAATPTILAQYPLSDYSSPSVAYAAIVTDGFIVCPALSVNQSLSQFVPVYAYEFADRTAPSYAPLVSFAYGAYHTGEIQYLFPRYHGGQGTPQPLNEAQEELSDQMVSYWTTFAQSGDPNSEVTPQWPDYTMGKYQSLVLPQPVTGATASLSARHQCGFWDNLQ